MRPEEEDGAPARFHLPPEDVKPTLDRLHVCSFWPTQPATNLINGDAEPIQPLSQNSLPLLPQLTRW